MLGVTGLTVLCLTATTLTGCAATVPMEAAPLADDPACAEVIVRLPNQVDQQPRQWTDAQSTGAWGKPSAILLRCGVPELGPTTLPCETVDGVDWVIDDTNAPNYVVTTFGRVPAVQVVLDTEIISSRNALEELGQYMDYLPSNGRKCVGAKSAGRTDNQL